MVEAENDPLATPAAPVADRASQEVETKPRFKVNTANLMFRPLQSEPTQQSSANSPVTTSSSSSGARPASQVHMNKLTLTNRRSSPASDTSASLLSNNGQLTPGAQPVVDAKNKTPVEYTDEELTNKGILLAGRFRSSSDINWEDEEDDWQPQLSLPNLPTSVMSADIKSSSSTTNSPVATVEHGLRSGSATSTFNAVSNSSTQSEHVVKPTAEGTAWSTKKITSASTSLADRIKEAKLKENGQLPRGQQSGAFGSTPVKPGQDAWNRFRIKSAVAHSVNNRGPPPLNPRLAAVEDDEPPTFRFGAERDADSGYNSYGSYGGGGFGRREASYNSRWQDRGDDEADFTRRTTHSDDTYDFSRRIGPSDGRGAFSSSFSRGGGEFSNRGFGAIDAGLGTSTLSSQTRKPIPARFLRPQADTNAPATTDVKVEEAKSTSHSEDTEQVSQLDKGVSTDKPSLSTKISEPETSTATLSVQNESATPSEPILQVQKEEMTSSLSALKERLEEERRNALDKQQKLEEMRNKMRLEKLSKEEEEEAKRKSSLEYMSQRHAKMQERAREKQEADTLKEKEVAACGSRNVESSSTSRMDNDEKFQTPKAKSWIAQKEQAMASLEEKRRLKKQSQDQLWKSENHSKIQNLKTTSFVYFQSEKLTNTQSKFKNQKLKASDGTTSLDLQRNLSHTKILLPSEKNYNYTGGFDINQLFDLGIPDTPTDSKENQASSQLSTPIPKIKVKLPTSIVRSKNEQLLTANPFSTHSGFKQNKHKGSFKKDARPNLLS